MRQDLGRLCWRLAQERFYDSAQAAEADTFSHILINHARLAEHLREQKEALDQARSKARR